MKKKTTPPKPKEFSTSPFAALKGVKAESPQPAAPPVAKPAPLPGKVADDADLFLRAMADVQRLHGERRPPAAKGGTSTPAPKPLVRKIDEEEQQVFHQALQQLKLDKVFRDELPDDTPPAQRGQNRLRQLRRGTIRIDYELDLHGLTRDEAIEALEAFIGGAHRRGQQAVLVITGKGNHSPDEAVLPAAVRQWLAREGKAMVSETATAPREMGGEGAIVVFITTSGRE
jgi:DNA-nicking Smr family endonuclease